MRFQARVSVDHREGIGPDPQAQILARQLDKLGFSNVSDVSCSKTIMFVLEAANEDSADETVVKMCDTFLANPVLETAEAIVELIPEEPKT